MFDIVMPLFNKTRFVEATIRSVLGQSFAHWRLFVVDDGSIDDGADVVRRFEDPRISLIEQANQGVGPARNAGIRAGSGDWIAFLDADDIWNADHLAELDALRTEFRGAALIGCAFGRASGAILPEQRSPGQPERRLARYFAECARGRELLVTSSAAVQRPVLSEVGDFKDLPGNEDVELWARLALHGPVAVSSRKTVNYRVGTGGITDSGIEGSSATEPTCRQDVSSTIPTLDQALPTVADPQLRQDIVDYMDAKIGNCLSAAILAGDVDYARTLRGFYLGKPKGKARIAAVMATLPKPIVSAVMTARRVIRRASGRT